MHCIERLGQTWYPCKSSDWGSGVTYVHITSDMQGLFGAKPEKGSVGLNIDLWTGVETEAIDICFAMDDSYSFLNESGRPVNLFNNVRPYIIRCNCFLISSKIQLKWAQEVWACPVTWYGLPSMQRFTMYSTKDVRDGQVEKPAIFSYRTRSNYPNGQK